MKTSVRRRFAFLVIAAIAVTAFGGLSIAMAQGDDAASLDGELLVAHGMAVNGQPMVMQTALKTKSGTVPVLLPASRHDQVVALAGRNVRLKGSRSKKAFQAASLAPQSGGVANAAAAPATTRTMKIAVVLMHLPGQSYEDVDKARAQSVFFGATNSIADYYQQQSGGQVSVTGTVFGWYNSTLSANDCNIYDWVSQGGAAAARDGYSSGSYTNLVVYTPGQSCSYAGIAYVGASGVYINGAMTTSVVAHELGHNLGNWHAGQYTCSAQTSGCLWDYGDAYDVMGSGSNRHFNAVHKYNVGWIPPTEVQSVSSGTQTIDLTASEHPVVAGSTELIYVQGRSGPRYAVERRESFGYDAGLSGVWIRTTGYVNTDDTILPYQAKALAPGTAFVDAPNGVTIRTLTDSGPTASVQVCIGTCGAAPPPTPTTTTTSTSTTTTTTKTTTTTTSTTTTTVGNPAPPTPPPPPPGGLGFVHTVVQGTLSRSGNSTLAMTVPSGSETTAGNRLVIAASVGTFRGNRGCSDSQGNVYTVDAVSSANSLFVCSAYLARPLGPGDMITVTYPGFSGISGAVASELSGIASDSAIDGVPHVGASSSAKVVSVSPLATSGGGVVFAVAANRYGLSAGNGFTGTGWYGGIGTAYVVSGSSGVYGAFGAVQGSTWSALMIAYRAA